MMDETLTDCSQHWRNYVAEPTSIGAFYEAKEKGIINRRQLQIVEYMCKAGGAVSQREVQRAFNDTSSSFHPRFCELERMKAITHVGEKKDPITGRPVKIYRVGNAPTEKLPKRLTAKAILKELLNDFHLDDNIYSVRENEGQGWEGPRVKRYAELITASRELTK